MSHPLDAPATITLPESQQDAWSPLQSEGYPEALGTVPTVMPDSSGNPQYVSADAEHLNVPGDIYGNPQNSGNSGFDTTIDLADPAALFEPNGYEDIMKMGGSALVGGALVGTTMKLIDGKNATLSWAKNLVKRAPK